MTIKHRSLSAGAIGNWGGAIGINLPWLGSAMQLLPGDRIAIKAMTGHAQQDITIKAIGIVMEVSEDKDKRVYVDWKLTDLHRKVRANGCFASIHGPYSVQDEGEWLGETFRL